VKAATLARLLEARAAERPIALLTQLPEGAQAWVEEDAHGGELALDPELLAQARAHLRTERSASLEIDARRIFVHAFLPPPELVIVGAVHVAQALARMARLADYRVRVIDPRARFAENEAFQDIEVSVQWPDEALAQRAAHSRLALVTLTHDPKLDDPALAWALRGPAFYIGALGSRKTHEGRLARLARLGFSAEELSRIHGPVGLAIGAASPAEIALSILAQITQARRVARPR
jgi:xanthine dehydrogenase accessory factor